MKKYNYLSLPINDLNSIISNLHEINIISQLLYYKLLSNKFKLGRSDALLIFKYSSRLLECLNDYVK